MRLITVFILVLILLQGSGSLLNLQSLRGTNILLKLLEQLFSLLKFLVGTVEFFVFLLESLLVSTRLQLELLLHLFALITLGLFTLLNFLGDVLGSLCILLIFLLKLKFECLSSLLEII